MLQSFTMFHGHHAYVSRYYHHGSWIRVDDWPVRERKGEAPYIVMADERDGKFYLTRDVDASPVYDECGYLSGAYGDEPTFEELEEVAKLVGFAGKRRVLIFGGGGRWIPALLSTPESKPFFSASTVKDKCASLLKKFPDCDAHEAGRLNAVFDLDLDAIRNKAE